MLILERLWHFCKKWWNVHRHWLSASTPGHMPWKIPAPENEREGTCVHSGSLPPLPHSSTAGFSALLWVNRDGSCQQLSFAPWLAAGFCPWRGLEGHCRAVMGRGFLSWLCGAVFTASSRSTFKGPSPLCPSWVSSVLNLPVNPTIPGWRASCTHIMKKVSSSLGWHCLLQLLGPQPLLLFLPLPRHPLLLVFRVKNTLLVNDSLYSVFTVLPTGLVPCLCKVFGSRKILKKITHSSAVEPCYIPVK